MGSVILKNVSKKFDKINALYETNAHIKEGEFTVFVGPSGCGKTTTLRLIAGLENVTTGVITINDKDVTWLPPASRKIAMVFQNYALYPHLTAYENLKYPLDLLKLSKIEKNRIINETAEKLEITDLLNRKPSQLSGGQKQRVAIGRAIVRKPEVFLLDEPLSNLDARLRETMRNYIRKIHNQLKKTTIYVTHDQHEAMTLADKIFIFFKGKIMQQGTPQEIYQNPKNLFTANFIGNPQSNSFYGVIKNNEIVGDYGSVNCAVLGCPKQKELFFTIRAHDVTVSDKNTKGMKAKFVQSEYLGSESYYQFQANKKSVLIASYKNLEFEKGKFYYLIFDKKKLFFFNKDHQRI